MCVLACAEKLVWICLCACAKEYKVNIRTGASGGSVSGNMLTNLNGPQGTVTKVGKHTHTHTVSRSAATERCKIDLQIKYFNKGSKQIKNVSICDRKQMTSSHIWLLNSRRHDVWFYLSAVPLNQAPKKHWCSQLENAASQTWLARNLASDTSHCTDVGNEEVKIGQVAVYLAATCRKRLLSFLIHSLSHTLCVFTVFAVASQTLSSSTGRILVSGRLLKGSSRGDAEEGGAQTLCCSQGFLLSPPSRSGDGSGWPCARTAASGLFPLHTFAASFQPSSFTSPTHSLLRSRVGFQSELYFRNVSNLFVIFHSLFFFCATAVGLIPTIN